MSNLFVFNKNEKEENFVPSPEESSFIVKVYRDFTNARQLKLESQPILGNRTLKQFWDDCNWDYNVLVDNSDANDPVVSYASTISRDKTNTFVTNLSLALMYPSVTAQNQNQEIDQLVSKVSRSVLEWAHDNDGRPAMGGHQKQVMYTHKQVVEGTIHIQDDWVDGKLQSQLVPNEEIFIQNYWQSNIQLQAYVMRVQESVTFEEAQQEFGDLPNWKHVKLGSSSNWGIDIDDPLFKDEMDGFIAEDKVHIMRAWYNIPKKDFKKFNVPKGQKSAKLFNVFINGIPMFKIDNLSPYRHGLFPINKGIFEFFSKSEFYWGNSMPNKAKEDKRWLDGWKTLIRHKAKLSVIPPLITFNGAFLDQDIFIPGQATQAPAGMTKDDIITIPGISNGLNNGDFAIMADAKNEIDQGNLSPQASGAQSPKRQTARESVIREQNEQQILGGFGLQVAFLIQARTFPILKMAYQFLPRNTVKKLSIPDQELNEGMMGNMEIIFEKPGAMTAETQMQASRALLDEERLAKEGGNPKKIVKINPEYIKNIDLYVKPIVDPQPMKTSSMRKFEAQEKYGLYRSDPALFNVRAAARRLVREMGDDETEMINTKEAPNFEEQMQEGQQKPNNRRNESMKRSAGQETSRLGEMQ